MAPYRIVRTLAPALLVLAAVGRTPAQNEPVASYELDGERRIVTETQLALEMAMHLRLRPEGQEAIQFLVDATIADIEARAEGIAVTDAEVDAYFAALEEQFEATGKDLDDFLEERGYTPEDYRDHVRSGLIVLKLTQKALRRDDVDGAMQQIWTEEARGRHEVVTDPERLPPGIVATVDGEAIGLRALGELLMRTQSVTAKEERIRKIVAREIIDARAQARGLRLTLEEVDAEIERRRAQVEADPRYAGVPFPKLLESLGHSVSTLRASPDFRAQIKLKRLVELDNPRERLAKELAEDREEVLRRHGARRQLEVVFLRAAEETSEFVSRTFEQAEAEMARLRKAAIEGESFGMIARLNSDDPGSKARDGALGERNQADTILPAAVMEAAFALEPGKVTEVMRGKDGVYLVRVEAIEPPPTDAELIRRMQAARIDATTDAIYEEADIRFGADQ